MMLVNRRRPGGVWPEPSWVCAFASAPFRKVCRGYSIIIMERRLHIINHNMDQQQWDDQYSQSQHPIRHLASSKCSITSLFLRESSSGWWYYWRSTISSGRRRFSRGTRFGKFQSQATTMTWRRKANLDQAIPWLTVKSVFESTIQQNSFSSTSVRYFSIAITNLPVYRALETTPTFETLSNE